MPVSPHSRKLLDQNAELAARLQVLERSNVEYRTCLGEREDENRRLKEELERLTERALLLEEEARWLKAQFFGRSSERRSSDVSPDQKRLFNEAEVCAAMATRCRNYYRMKSDPDGAGFAQLTDCDPLQQRAFDLLAAFPVDGNA